ncbi:MAG: ABC transporter permease, partial [Cyclobacteriaceae bacterium]|nr:ABC transporter permease [Cyclobacteriaceae bacterium]
MNLSYFISKRISRQSGEGFSSTIHKIAVASIGIGLGATIISFLILRGFQDTVKEKIYSFSGHMVVTKFTMNNSMEETPLDYNTDFYNDFRSVKGIRHVQEFAHKTGLIKTDDEVLGVVLKGIGKSYDTSAFSSNMIEGRFIHLPDSGYSSEVLLSKRIARKIKANVGDQVIIHFFQNPPRFRRLTVTGIYETNLSEYFDDKIIIGDLRLIARLNEWADSIAGGLEVFVSDVNRIPEIAWEAGERIDFDWNIMPVSEKYIQVFEWLHLLSRQVNILLIIILTVVCVNMISVILILVMERTQMIGLMKAMGAGDRLNYAKKLFTKTGVNESPRRYRNNLIFLLAESTRIDGLKDAVRALMAWERVLKDIETEQSTLAQSSGADFRALKDLARGRSRKSSASRSSMCAPSFWMPTGYWPSRRAAGTPMTTCSAPPVSGLCSNASGSILGKGPTSIARARRPCARRSPSSRSFSACATTTSWSPNRPTTAPSSWPLR